MLPGPGVDLVLNLEDELPEGLGQFQHVECISVLEHAPRPWLLAANLERLMAPGCTLYVTVPMVWRIHAYPSDYWRMTPEALPLLFPSVEWERRMMAGSKLVEDQVQIVKLAGFPYMARTETCGFGRRA